MMTQNSAKTGTGTSAAKIDVHRVAEDARRWVASPEGERKIKRLSIQPRRRLTNFVKSAVLIHTDFVNQSAVSDGIAPVRRISLQYCTP